MSHRNAPLHLCKINLSISLFKAASSSLPVILEIGAAIYPVALCILLPSKWPWDFSRTSFFFLASSVPSIFLLPQFRQASHLSLPCQLCPLTPLLLISFFCLHWITEEAHIWSTICSWLCLILTCHRSHSELSKMLSFYACGLCQKLFSSISLPSMSNADFSKLFILYLSIADKPEKVMAPHSSTLAWKILWTEEPVGCSPQGRWWSDMTERLHFHFSLSCIGEGNGNPLQCSCLENPRNGGAWWAAVYGVAQSRTRLKRLSNR